MEIADGAFWNSSSAISTRAGFKQTTVLVRKESYDPTYGAQALEGTTFSSLTHQCEGGHMQVMAKG
jgi:hypothetical protein